MTDIENEDFDAYNYQNNLDIKEMNNYSKKQAAEDLKLFEDWLDNKKPLESGL